MTAEPNFVLDLTLALGASALGGYIALRLKQPALLGYLVTGLIIGPYGLALQTDVEQIQALAEVGIAFLLFALGVEFSLTELKRVRAIALVGSVLQMGLTTLLVGSVSLLSGSASSVLQGIFLGLVLSLSSTAVVLKTLTERGETNTVHGQVMLALLIAQDLALGLMLALLPVLNQPEALGLALGLALLKILVFLAGAWTLGRWGVPRLMQVIAATESSELFLLTVVVLCLGVAWLTSQLGLSIAMGAFVAGLMISEIDYADQALGKILPLRDTFACLFFASIGMLIDPTLLVNNLDKILELVTLIMVGKALIILPIVLGFGYSLKTAVKTSFGLNQIGEFSFVLALVGLEMGLITEQRYSLLLGTIAISLMLTPLWINLATPVVDWLHRLPALKDYLKQSEEPKLLSVPEDICDHVIVAGYGRVGQVLVNVLLSRGYPVLVVENSETAVQSLRNRHAPLVQIPFVYGDAENELVLEKTRLETAKALAITLPDPASTRLVLQRALAKAPGLDVIARSHTNEEIDVLTQLGAREVVQPEFEAALELGSHLLNTLGEQSQEIQSVLGWIRQDQYRSIRPVPQLGES
ncbi:MAG TPA: cation:proton antiporter [Leptolyngbyaceae cyanobacterium M65_K2018_010]|nr:cation:proton antiporter [Leptolyngbyaceae cyanobacterium M65_K2018_010]